MNQSQEMPEESSCPIREGELTIREVENRAFPAIGGSILAAAALPGAPSRWLVVTGDLRLATLDFASGVVQVHLHLPGTGVPFQGLTRKLPVGIAADAPRPLLDELLTLLVSPCGTMAAAVPTYGQRGVVADLASGTVLLSLDRGDYYFEVSCFPLAFFSHAGRTLLVHATAWNRLDISDPRTGAVLTPRTLPTAEEYKQNPDDPRHLDYFHASLSISPDGRRICSNGWHWHPFGAVRCWDLQRWLTENPWESENGPSLNEDVWGRSYYWDGALCWLDNDRVAIWGDGDDEARLKPSALILDVRQDWGQAPRVVPGPPGGSREYLAIHRLDDGTHVLGRTPRSIGTFCYDGYLHAWTAADGYSVWGIDNDGARLFHAPDFVPLARDPITHNMLCQNADHSFRVCQIHRP